MNSLSRMKWRPEYCDRDRRQKMKFNKIGIDREENKVDMPEQSEAMEEKKTEKGTVYIDMRQIKPNDRNMYEMSEIEKLADMIKMSRGILQNLIVKPADEDGMYTLTTGERRWRAANYLRERGEYPPELNNTVPCTVVDPQTIDLPLSAEAKEDFAILVTNQYRNKTDGETYMEIMKWRKIFSELRKQGVEFLASDPETGKQEVQIKEIKTRKLVADQVGISTGQVSRYEDVERNGSDKVMEMLMRDNIDLSTAEKLTKLSRQDQEEVMTETEGEKEAIVRAVNERMERRQNKLTLSRTYVEEELGQLIQEMPNEITISPAAKRQYRRAVDQLKSLLCEVR